MKTHLSVGNTVRVIQSNGKPGPTRWVITRIGESGQCFIREADKPNHREQEFDTSLLKYEDDGYAGVHGRYIITRTSLPRGPWAVYVLGAGQPISKHGDDREAAVAAVEQYIAGDRRRSGQHG